jgi:hypothetical protein
MIRSTQPSPMSLGSSVALRIPTLMVACGVSDTGPSDDGEDAEGSGGDGCGGGDGDGDGDEPPNDATKCTCEAEDSKIQFRGRWVINDPKALVISVVPS